jgi:hypothetical protein
MRRRLVHGLSLRGLGFCSGSVKPVAKSDTETTFSSIILVYRGPGSSVGIATDYGLDGPGIESQRLWWSRGLRAGLWNPRLRVRSRPKPSEFS